MADKSTRLMLTALSRAVAAPSGLPLFAGKNGQGLFPATASARQAADHCRAAGLLEIAGSREIGTITAKGKHWLLSQDNPRLVLEDFVRVLEERETQVRELVLAARDMSSSLDSLKSAVEALRSGNSGRDVAAKHHLNGQSTTSPTVADDIVKTLTAWHDATSGDCPLPDLFRRLASSFSTLTIGLFHDALRRLHDRGAVYLHPWTGPLYELPEPPFALLIGHEIAYYASLRTTEAG